MSEIEELKAQNAALRSVVIALYSLHLDRPLIDSRATHYFEQIVALGQLEEKTAKIALEQLLGELHSYGYPK